VKQILLSGAAACSFMWLSSTAIEAFLKPSSMTDFLHIGWIFGAGSVVFILVAWFLGVTEIVALIDSLRGTRHDLASYDSIK
jgi:hypothetical protein